MKRHLAMCFALTVLAVVPLSAQRPDEHHPAPNRAQGNHAPANHAQANRARANQGRVPAAPVARTNRTAAPEAERFDGGRVNSLPHVNHDRWYGHDQVGDARFHLATPFAHGRFAHVGPSFRYNVLRVDAGLHRFWLPGGFYFEVAPWDWPVSADWCWDCGGDDFAVYDDPDHPGWYLVYNIHTGQYVHAQYMGS